MKTREGMISDKQMRWLQEKQGLGIHVNNVALKPTSARIVSRVQKKQFIVDVTVREGKYREVRRLLQVAGLEVKQLTRTQFGPFLLRNLGKGDVREVAIPSDMEDLCGS